MSDATKKSLWEGFVMWLRVMVLGVIPALLIMFEAREINWGIIGFTVAIAALKALDTVLHKYGKITENASFEKGLTRF